MSLNAFKSDSKAFQETKESNNPNEKQLDNFLEDSISLGMIMTFQKRSLEVFKEKGFSEEIIIEKINALGFEGEQIIEKINQGLSKHYKKSNDKQLEEDTIINNKRDEKAKKSNFM